MAPSSRTKAQKLFLYFEVYDVYMIRYLADLKFPRRIKAHAIAIILRSFNIFHLRQTLFPAKESEDTKQLPPTGWVAIIHDPLNLIKELTIMVHITGVQTSGYYIAYSMCPKSL